MKRWRRHEASSHGADIKYHVITAPHLSCQSHFCREFYASDAAAGVALNCLKSDVSRRQPSIYWYDSIADESDTPWLNEAISLNAQVAGYLRFNETYNRHAFDFKASIPMASRMIYSVAALLMAAYRAVFWAGEILWRVKIIRYAYLLRKY